MLQEFSVTPSTIKRGLEKDPQAYGRLEAYRETGVPFKVEFDYGKNLAEMIEKFGEEVVFQKARMAMSLDVGSRCRAWMEQFLLEGKSPKEAQIAVQENLNAWRPGVVTRTKKEVKPEKVKSLIGRLSPEQKEALLRELQQEGLL